MDDLVPDYLLAASAHNSATGNEDSGGFFSGIIESLSNAPKFFGASAASAGIGFINTGIAVGNWFRSEEDKIAEVNTEAWLSEYDDDLGRYYRENATAVDAMGFVVGSIVPGMAGVKALNVGQKALTTARGTGMMGANISRATGLLTPAIEANSLRAAQQIAETSARFSRLDAGVLRALGSGVGQNVLESAAFEVFALGAQFNSNFIKQADASDIVTNVILGAGIGGAIGGLFTGIKIDKSIRSQVNAFDQMGREGIFQHTLPKGLEPGTYASQAFLNRKAVEDFRTLMAKNAEEGAELPEKLTLGLVQKYISDAERTMESLNNQIIEQVRKMSDTGDVKWVKQLAKSITSMDADSGAKLMLGAQKFKRVGDVHVKKPFFAKSQNMLDFGEAIPMAKTADSGITWNKMWGHGAGTVMDELPSVVSIADKVRVSAGRDIKGAVDKVVKSFKHSAKVPVDVASNRVNLTEAQARYIWADNSRLSGPLNVSETDIPLLEAALAQFDQVGQVTITGLRGKTLATASDVSSLRTAIYNAKDKQIARMMRNKVHPDVIAEKLNVNRGYIDGTAVADDLNTNYFARQKYAEAQGFQSPVDLHYQPQYFGVESDPLTRTALNDLDLEVETTLRGIQKARQATVDTAVAEALSVYGQVPVTRPNGTTALVDVASTLPENNIVQEAMRSASRFGSGARLFTSANGNYGSLESIMQRVGQIKNEMDIRATAAIREEWKDISAGLRASPKDAAELAVINERLAGMTERYGIAERVAGEPGILTLRPIKHIEEARNGSVPSQLPPSNVDAIFVEGEYAARAIEAHIQQNGQRVSARKSLRDAQGQGLNQREDVFYPIKPDPRRRPFHAFVIDESTGGVARTTMIHAPNSKDLGEMIAKVNREYPDMRVVTKGSSEEYHRALGDYDYNKTLNELDFDSELVSKGINSQFIPETDGALVADKFMNFHTSQSRKFNADIISSKYNAEFDALEKLGREFGNLSESRYPDMASMAFDTKNNPFVEYMKTALNISNVNDYGMLVTANRWIDSGVSKVWNSANNLMRAMKGVDDVKIDAVNSVFKKHGYNSIAASAENLLLANHRADSAVLSRFVRGAQSILSTTFLRWDALHALNNKIGSVILTSTELRHVLDAARKGNPEIAGKLTELSHLTLPGTKGSQILSPGKLMANAYKNSFDPALRARAISEGFVPGDISEAFKVLDSLTLNGTESTALVNKKLAEAMEGVKKVSNFGEKITGNKYIEGLNRFMAYDIMRQMTDPLVSAGMMSSREAGTYINTFVNRTQVTLNAAQRPMAFQGPVGMAVGLFQSYQFNLFQQLFRYIGDGSAKTVAAMTGLQTGFYGLSGLPGFKFLNESIIGQAAGNFSHADINSEAPAALGKQLAELLIYGAPSAAFGVALYSRGDLTPQHPTIIPSKISDLPVVSMYSRIYDNLMRSGDMVGGGAGVWNSMLSGMEHNSFNRPLSGLAQVIRGMTDGTGEVRAIGRTGEFLASNDLFSLATLFRMAGGKPLDEAMVRDEKWRTNAYQQADAARRKKASDALRLSVAATGGLGPTDEAMASAFDVFTNTGGKTKDFNRWALQRYSEASIDEAERLMSSLQSPYAYRLQRMMGGQ